MKEIHFSDHARLKIEALANHNLTIDPSFIIDVIRSPDKLEMAEENKRIAQKCLDQNLVLRVVYRGCQRYFSDPSHCSFYRNPLSPSAKLQLSFSYQSVHFEFRLLE